MQRQSGISEEEVNYLPYNLLCFRRFSQEIAAVITSAQSAGREKQGVSV